MMQVEDIWGPRDLAFLLWPKNHFDSLEERIWFEILVQAALGWGWTEPNPPVGAAVLDASGILLSLGYHPKAGTWHAEIQALGKLLPLERDQLRGHWVWSSSMLPSCLKGASVWVTLEPCFHSGKTPPCALLLGDLPIAEVRFLLIDPNPQTREQSKNWLLQKGKKVVCLGDECPTHPAVMAYDLMLKPFFFSQIKKRPLVILKVASTVNGQMNLSNGQSQWITGPKARSLSRTLRGLCQAVLTTAKTVVADRPKMDTRETIFASKTIPIVIWDSQGLLAKEKWFPTCQWEGRPIFWLTEPSVMTQVACHIPSTVHPMVFEGSFLDKWKVVLDLCRQNQWQSVWVEAGASFTSTVIENNCWDWLFWFQAGLCLDTQQSVGVSPRSSPLTNIPTQRWHLHKNLKIDQDGLFFWINFSSALDNFK